MTKHWTLFVVCVSVVGWIAGCGGTSPDAYKGPLATVSGRVTVDGKPAPKGCQVTFTGTEKSFLAAGVVQDDGRYELKFKGSSSVPAIKYNVTVSPPVEAATGSSTKTADPAAVQNSMAGMNSNDFKKPAKDDGPIPLKYRTASTSGLTYTIEKGSKPIDIELKR